MKTLRAFFAIHVPNSTQKLLKKIQSMLIHELPLKAVHWKPISNMHVTLQFLKELQVFDLEKLISNVQNELKTFPPFQLQFEKLVFFPSAHHPVVIALEVGPSDLLSNLADKIGNNIVALHYPITHHSFRGHLTIGRLRHPEQQAYSLDLIKLPLIPNITINEIWLIESKPDAKHQIYTPLAHFRLE